MIESQMNAVAFARKLRARRDELKAKRKRELIKFNQAFENWKKELGKWLAVNGKKRAATILRKEGHNHRYRDDSYISVLLKGHPEPPRYPSSTTIEQIDSMLRQIAITGQNTIRVTEDMVNKYFKDENDNEEGE